MILLVGCARLAPPPGDPAVAEKPVRGEGAPLADLEGGWVLSRDWEGFMGVAIQFHRDGTFDYWFYSDVADPDGPKYPVRGKWKWNDSVLTLECDHRLHSTRWHVDRHRGEPALLPEYA